MKQFSKVFSALFYILMFTILAATIGSVILKRPMLMTTIRSNSMYPSLERGDVVFIKGVAPDKIEINDIVVFTAETGNLSSQGLIMHRIVDGNLDNGFITKGDANERSDQDDRDAGLIMPEYIYSKAVTIGGHPLKVPLIGHLALWAENLQSTPYMLPGLAFIIAVIVAVSELTTKKSKRSKKTKMDMPLIYFFSGVTITVLIGATMLASSQHIIIPYEVSDTSEGVIMGSNVGILKKGEFIEERPLSDLSNQGFFPVTVFATTRDPQITFNHNTFFLRPGQDEKLTMDVHAINTGKYNTSIWVGMFFPLLPVRFIYFLAQVNFWFALSVVSLIPGIPLMLYPLFDRQMRNITVKEIRRKFRRIQSNLSYFS